MSLVGSIAIAADALVAPMGARAVPWFIARFLGQQFLRQLFLWANGFSGPMVSLGQLFLWASRFWPSRFWPKFFLAQVFLAQLFLAQRFLVMSWRCRCLRCGLQPSGRRRMRRANHQRSTSTGFSCGARANSVAPNHRIARNWWIGTTRRRDPLMHQFAAWRKMSRQTVVRDTCANGPRPGTSAQQTWGRLHWIGAGTKRRSFFIARICWQPSSVGGFSWRGEP